MTHDYKRITKQFGVLYLFSILALILSPLLTILLTRVLSLEEYGVYSILSITVTSLIFILTLEMHTFIKTKLPGIEYKEKLTVLASILTFSFLILAVFGLLVSLPAIKIVILKFLKIEMYGNEFLLSMWLLIVSVLFNLFAAFLIANKRIELNTVITFIYNYLWAVLLLLFFAAYKTFSISIVFSLWMLSVIIVFLAMLYIFRNDISFFFSNIKKINVGLLKNVLRFSLPLVLVTISASLMTLIDRYMLNRLMGTSTVGIYSLAFSLAGIASTFSSMVFSVLYPYIAHAWNEKQNYHSLYNVLLKYSLLIVLPAATGLFVLREQMITLISGVSYLPGASALAILIFFPIISSLISILTSNHLLTERTKYVAKAFIAGVSINLILNLLLIPKYDIIGAALAFIGAYLLILFVLYFESRKQFVWDYRFLKLKRVLLSNFLMGLVLWLLNPEIYITKILVIMLGAIFYVAMLFILKVFANEEKFILISFLPNRLQSYFKN